MPTFSVVGKSLPQVNAREKVSGTAIFVADLRLPGMLHAKVLRSIYPHARIVRIDIERARRLPGVRAVVTGADTPYIFGALRHHKDQHVLAVERVRFVGEEVAAVAAVDESTALDALEVIDVEYAELPGVFDPEEALRPGAPLIHPQGNLAREIRIERGDIEAGFGRAAVVHEATYETGYQYHGFTEPMGTVASVDASGRLTVWMPTQSVHFSRRILAEGLGLPISRIRVVQTYVGGGFGGKFGEDANPFIAARLALASGWPVRLINTRIEDFQGARSAMPARIRLRMGVDIEGRITAKETEIIADNGAYCGLAPEIVHVTAMRQDSLYRVEHIRTIARLAYTNKIPSGAFRGFGGQQMAFALESHMDELADRLGMDPLEIRLRNAIREGDTSVHGWTMGSCGLTECLGMAARAIDWSARRAAAGRQTGPIRRGVGLACAVHVTANRQMADWDGSSVAIKVNEDGRVSLITGEADIGQGAATVLTQIVAEVLGIPPEHVTFTVPDTDTAPYTFGAAASRTTLLAGNAAMRAARGVREALLAIAAERLEVAPEDLTIENAIIHVVGAPDRKMTVGEAAVAHIIRPNGEGIFVRASYDAPTVMADRNFYGNVAPAYTFAAQAAEVEVDIETGAVRVLRLVSADDVGTAINPMAVEGQIHGAVVQGIGYALCEGLLFEDGRLLNGNLADYTLPVAESVPRIDTALAHTSEPNGPFGAKGASECAIIPTAPAIANAIANAVGVRVTSLPISSEKVIAALEARRSR